MNIRTPLIPVLLAGIAAFTFWLGQQPGREAPPHVEDESPHFFMEKFSILFTGDDGLPDHRLLGERMVRMQLDGPGEITQPVVTIFGEDDSPPWTVVAARAVVAADHEEVELIDEVAIDRPSQDPAEASRLLAERLTIWPTSRTAATDGPVSLLRGQVRHDAVGMAADLEADTIEFHSQVRTAHER